MHRRSTIKHALAAFLLTAVVALPAMAQPSSGAAPAFDLPGTGKSVKLADLHGKLVYLDFWASWCAPCKTSFPWMNEMQAKYGPQGLQIVAINVDAKRADAEQFLAATPYQFTVAFDVKGETPKTYAIKGMPSSFLIGPDGRILVAHTGFRDSDRAELEAKIKQALAAR